MNAKPDAEVRAIISMARLCEQYHCLPKSGGLLDQDSYVVLGMQAVLSADAEKADVERNKQSNGPNR